MGHSLLFSTNSSTRSVADITTSLRGVIPARPSRNSSARRGTTRLSNPSRMSVFTPRSCASSTITTEYLRNSRSVRISRSRMPSVMNFKRVSSSRMTFLSYRTWYPTSRPSVTFSSRATRVAVLVTATRRGCVTATAPGCAAHAGSP